MKIKKVILYYLGLAAHTMRCKSDITFLMFAVLLRGVALSSLYAVLNGEAFLLTHI